MELTKKKTNRYNNYDEVGGSNDEVAIVTSENLSTVISRTILLYSFFSKG